LTADVSVIVPTFHREMLVADAIGSALEQRRVSVDVIVLDDSPSGSASSVVQAIGDSRVSYVKREVPSGGRPAVVRNEGFRLSRGRFVHFLDDDDVLEDGALAALVDALDRRPSAGMAFGAVVPFGENEAILRDEQRYFLEAARSAKGLVHPLHLAAQLLFRNTVLVNSACLARRDAFEAVGGYDAEVTINEDVELWLRVARSTGFAYVDRPVVRYRTGASSLMRDTLTASDGAQPKFRGAYARMYEKYRREYGSLEFYALKLLARTLLNWV
jgi:GT2 family glycosyltransferase